MAAAEDLALLRRLIPHSPGAPAASVVHLSGERIKMANHFISKVWLNAGAFCGLVMPYEMHY
jgi:hypothetical protein